MGRRADRWTLPGTGLALPGTTEKWFTFTNGAHIDSLDPATFYRWYDFLELFVAHQAPIVNSAVIRAAAPVIYEDAMGLPDTDPITLPLDPIQAIPTYSAAVTAFGKLPEIRVLFDNGAGSSATGTSSAGDPYPGFEKDFSAFPIPGTTAQTWYLGPQGTLADQPPANEGINSYTSNASTLPLTDFGSNTGSGGLWGNASQWQWNWEQYPPGIRSLLCVGPVIRPEHVIGASSPLGSREASAPDDYGLTHRPDDTGPPLHDMLDGDMLPATSTTACTSTTRTRAAAASRTTPPGRPCARPAASAASPTEGHHLAVRPAVNPQSRNAKRGEINHGDWVGVSAGRRPSPSHTRPTTRLGAACPDNGTAAPSGQRRSRPRTSATPAVTH